MLAWYLREPLAKKYLLPEVKKYSVDQFATDKRYLLNSGDFITGTTNAENEVAILITKNRNIKGALRAKLKPDTAGNWTYQLPVLEDGIYLLTIAYSSNKEITYLQNFKIRIKSNIFEGLFLPNQSPPISLVSKNIPKKEHPQLYFADLEYNLKTGSLEKIGSGTASNEALILSKERPPETPELFNYRFVAQKDNKIIQEGWGSVLKETALQDNNLQFQIRVSNIPGAKIEIFSSKGNLLWTELVPE